MTTERHLLLVGSKPDVLNRLLFALCQRLSVDSLHIRTALDPQAALLAIREAPVHLLVLCSHALLPDAEPLLLAAQDANPRLRRILVLPHPDPQTVQHAQALALSRLLQEPRTHDDFIALADEIGAVLGDAVLGGLVGTVRFASVSELLRSLAATRRSGVVYLRSPVGVGELFVMSGALVQAQFLRLGQQSDYREGHEALEILNELDEAEFHIEPYYEPRRRGIQDMNAHSLDDSDVDQAEPPAPSTQASVAPPSKRSIPARPTGQTKPTPPSEADQETPRHLDEVALCTRDAVPVSGFRCRDPQARAELVRFLYWGADRLNHQLKLGELQRVDILSRDDAAVAAFRGDHCAIGFRASKQAELDSMFEELTGWL